MTRIPFRFRVAVAIVLFMFGSAVAVRAVSHRARREQSQAVADPEPTRLPDRRYPTALPTPADDRQRARTYKVSIDSAVRLTEDGPDTLAFELRGNVRLTPAAAGDESRLTVAIDVRELRAHADGAAATPEQTSRLSEELARPFVVALDSNGRPARFAFAPSLDGLVRGLAKLVTGALSYSPSPQTRWTATELDALGEHLTTYERDGRLHHLRRRRGPYIRLMTPDGWVEPTRVGVAGSEGETALVTNGSGILEQVDGWERTELALTAGTKLSSRAQVKATLIDLTDVDSAERERAFSSDLDLEPISGGRVLASTRRRQDEQTVGTATLGALAGELSRDAGEPSRPGTIARLGALMRLQPKAVAAATELLSSADAQVGGGLVAALAAAGTPGSVDALAAVVRSNTASDLRTQAVMALGLASTVTPDGLRALDDSTASPDPEIRRTAILALGNAAPHATDPQGVDALGDLTMLFRQGTTEDDKIVALRALGNSGDPRALPLVDEALQGDADLRAVAAWALRRIPGSDAEERLRNLLRTDADADVRLAAASAMAFRSPIPVDVLASAVRQEADDRVREEIVRVLGRALGASPGARLVLQTVAIQDPSESVRSAARALTGGA